MSGNPSVLCISSVVVSHLDRCPDVQAPLIININNGFPANICAMCLLLAGPGDRAAEIFFCDVVIFMITVIS